MRDPVTQVLAQIAPESFRHQLLERRGGQQGEILRHGRLPHAQVDDAAQDGLAGSQVGAEPVLARRRIPAADPQGTIPSDTLKSFLIGSFRSLLCLLEQF